MGNHQPQEVRDQAVALYRNGKTAPEIAAALGAGSTTVYRWLKSAGIVPADLIAAGKRAKFGGITDEVAAEMERLYRDDERSIYQIANRFGDSGDRVHRILRQRGVPIRHRGGRLQPIVGDTRETVIALWLAGEAVDAIAREVGAGRERVKYALREAGHEPTKRIRRGERHPFWKDGSIIVSSGYRFVLIREDHPMAVMRNGLGYVAEHRLVMAKSLGRPLDPSETVHHINGIRDDNRLENLQLRQGRHGKGARYTCLDCGSHNVSATPI